MKRYPAVLATVAVTAACASGSAIAEPSYPVERFFRYDLTGYGVDEVASQCDNHGHRVFSSSSGRGDGDLQVVADPSCPGGEPS